RLVQAIAVNCYIGSVPSFTDRYAPDPGSALFQGTADEGEWRIGDDNKITLEARDYTGLLIDLPWVGKQHDLKAPLKELIENVIAQYPVASGAGFTVEVRSSGGNVRLGDVRSNTGQSLAASSQSNAWTEICHLAAEAGLVAWMEGKKIVVDSGQAPSDPEAPPAFIYGKNLKRLEIKKRIGGKRTKRVLVKCWDVATSRCLRGIWPETSAAPGASASATDCHVFNVSHVKNERELARIAEYIWRRMRFQDVAIELETRSMTGLGNEDLLRLISGSPIQVYLDENERQFLHGRGFSDRRRYLLDRGYASDVATSIALGYENLTPLYQVVQAEHTFDARDGYSLRILASSYLSPF
ncbi:MAG TPA: hypothetical protein VK181_06385, partial [Rhizobium sp.]|nr:hypothetical protein [Rhizobium sp.]